jgi:hypothetical protein
MNSTEAVSNEKAYIIDRANHLDNINEFEYRGLKCLVKSVYNFNWNGYVSFPKDHPDCNKSTDELDEIYEVHGGVTFSHNNMIGFDTMHILTDFCPFFYLQRQCLFPEIFPETVYRSFDYVKTETMRLADQVIDRANSTTNESDSMPDIELID